MHRAPGEFRGAQLLRRRLPAILRRSSSPPRDGRRPAAAALCGLMALALRRPCAQRGRAAYRLVWQQFLDGRVVRTKTLAGAPTSLSSKRVQARAQRSRAVESMTLDAVFSHPPSLTLAALRAGSFSTSLSCPTCTHRIRTRPLGSTPASQTTRHTLSTPLQTQASASSGLVTVFLSRLARPIRYVCMHVCKMCAHMKCTKVKVRMHICTASLPHPAYHAAEQDTPFRPAPLNPIPLRAPS